MWRLASTGLVAVGLAIASSYRMPDTSSPRWMAQLSVAPKAIARVTGGFQNVLADVLYIRFSTYWGHQLTNGRHFMNLEPLLDRILELDPDFKAAYTLAALALGDADDVEAAIRILERGMKRSPRDPFFPYRAGLVVFFNTDSYLRAARYFERAASLPGAMPEARFMAINMYRRSGRRDLAIRAWMAMYETSRDRSVREVARRGLERLGVRVPVVSER